MLKGDMEQTSITESAEETEAFAAHLATRLRGGEVIELVSDLGGGKTTFTRGLARGLGTTDAVASPTFTISREYGGGRLRIYHFDFYRLPEAGIIADELAEIVGEQLGIVVVEWAGVVQDVLPKERVTITITTTGEQQRQLSYAYPDALAYLFGEGA